MPTGNPPIARRKVATTPRPNRPDNAGVRQQTRSKAKTRRRNGELLKMGLVASLTAVTLTGFRIVKPMNPVHTVSAVALLALTALHILHFHK